MDLSVPNLPYRAKLPPELHWTLPLTPATPETLPESLIQPPHRRRNVAASIWGPDTNSSPPTSTSKLTRPFSVYKAILRHPNVFFDFALRLPYDSMIALYAIDKEFHYRLNKYSVSLIRDYTNYHAPRAAYIFGWALHRNLCISDPMLRPMDGRHWLARDVPGFRWVGMVLWREKAVCQILTVLAREGHRVPARTKEAVMKFWSVMEMPSTNMRLKVLQDKNRWADEDIMFFHLFTVKLDMRFADPILGSGACALSHLLLMQKSLSTLWKVLTGKVKLTYDDVTCMLFRTYTREEIDPAELAFLESVMEVKVPTEQRGVLSREEWEVTGARMKGAADMVIEEGVRRNLHVQQYFIDFVLYGHMDFASQKNIPTPVQLRRDQKMTTPKEGWPARKERIEAIVQVHEKLGLKAPSLR